MRKRARVARRLTWLLCAVAACREAPERPSWIPLAPRLVLVPRTERVAYAWRDGREVEVVPQDGLELRIPLVREDWVAVPSYEGWNVPLALHLSPSARTSLRLETERGSIPCVNPALLRHAPSAGFGIFRGALVLGGVADVPERATLSCRISEPDSDAADAGRLRLGRFSGAGVVVLPGSRASVTLDLPPRSALCFGLALDPILEAETASEVRFRVHLDGAPLFERTLALADHAAFAWHRVELPPDGRVAARLDFAVEGALARTAFLDPLIAPLELGRPGARPWAESRPDVVVLLADTFRADNLAAQGGPPGVTPNLDALAAHGVRFAHAWSVSSWTLPAHAALFSGLYPPQVGVASDGQRMAGDVTSIVERLAHAGYRTGAVTDGGFVSAQFGMDQGFLFFSERRRDIEETLAEAQAFLDADDGRPTFLFVHSYRVHMPFRVSAQTREELGERLAIQGEPQQLLAELRREAGVPASRRDQDLDGIQRTPRVVALAESLRAHYLGGVADLDRALGPFLEQLERSGFLEHGYLIFTSDHGEAFVEHGALFHSGVPYEEQARVPLLIRGRGLAPRVVDDPVSLIDLAPTLASAAGLERDPLWPGRDLLAPLADQVLFGFQGEGDSGNAMFVLDAPHKVLCAPDAQQSEGYALLGAFDLERDPHERHDARADAAWPQELLRAHHAALLRALEPLTTGEATALDADHGAELRALGY